MAQISNLSITSNGKATQSVARQFIAPTTRVGLADGWTVSSSELLQLMVWELISFGLRHDKKIACLLLQERCLLQQSLCQLLLGFS